LSTQAIPFLLYGSFRIENPQIEVQNGIATPLSMNAGSIALAFDSTSDPLAVDFRDPRKKFAVSVDGDGYRVTNPPTDLLVFSSVQIRKEGVRYVYALTLSGIQPTCLVCSDIAVTIGGQTLWATDSLQALISTSGAGYRISPRSGASSFLLTPNDHFSSWALPCFLDFRSNNPDFWVQSDGITCTPPPYANATFKIAGDAGSGIEVVLLATEQPDDINCGEIIINQIDNVEAPGPRQPLRFYGIEMHVAPSGLVVSAVHWNLYDPTQPKKYSPVSTLEDIPSAFYPNRFIGDWYVSFRGLIAEIWMQVDAQSTWSSGVEFGGEIKPRFIYDRSNTGIRLFSSRILGSTIRCEEIDNFTLLISGSASPRRAPIAALLKEFTTTPDPPENDLGIRGLAFGDITLVIGQSPKLRLVDDLFVDFRSAPGIGEPWTGWRFPIVEIRKTPLKGDAVGIDTAEPSGLDPRTEVYEPTTPGAVTISFGWADQKASGDLFAGFAAANATVGALQPENVQIAFSDWTTASYSIAGPNVSSGYKRLDATMVFRSYPADIGSPLSGAGNSPQIRWREDFGATIKSDRALRRVWDSGLTSEGAYRAAYLSFLESNASQLTSRKVADGVLQLSLPYGWGAKFDPAPNPRVIAIFQAIKNEGGADLALQERTSRGARQFQLLTSAWETEGPLSADYWFPATSDINLDAVFPSPNAVGRPSQVVSPLDPNWSGFVTAKGTVVAPAGLPPSLAYLLQELQYDYIAWDGQGVAAICTFQDEHPSGDQLRLTKFTLIIARSQIQTLFIEFAWKLPFFSFGDADLWLPFQGRFEKTSDGSKIVFKCGAIGAFYPGLFGGVIDVGFSDIELLPGVSGTTSIRINGTMTVAPSQTLTVFDGPIPSISFRNMEFDFDNPFSKWGMPNLKLDTELTLFPFGFRYQLYGLNFELYQPTDKTTRVLTFSGGLQYATQSTGFLGKPEFLVTLPLTITLGQIKFEDPVFTGLDGAEFNLFGLFTIGFHKLQLAAKVISGDVTVSSNWNSGAQFEGSFSFGDGKSNRNKFWHLGLRYGPNDGKYKVGPAGASDFGILIGHDATFDGLRQTLISADVKGLEALLDTPRNWQYSDEFPWFAALWFQNIDVGLPPAFLGGGPGALVLSDSGLFRGLIPLRMMHINFADLDLGIDWRNREIAASVTLTNLEYGPYRMDAGTVSALISPKQFMVSWGFPFDDDWGRAVKLHWDPPPAIPINAVEGGIMLGVANEGFGAGVALRVGYQDVIGSDGGAFGAYVRGEIMLGGSVAMQVVTGSEAALAHTGTISLHIEAAGGLVIAGIRWDVLRVWVDAGVQFTLVVGKNYAHAFYGARFSAGYEVCPTPCTCVSGSVSFTYGMNAQLATKYGWDPSSATLLPRAEAFLREERVGDALVELLRADFS
jgi:hypothetical protein